MSEHTPGPWVVDEGAIDSRENMVDSLSAQDCKWVAVGIEDEDGYSASIAYCAPENAPVIAAAPDLLDALRTMLRYHSCSSEHRCSACTPAREAIAKATKGGE